MVRTRLIAQFSRMTDSIDITHLSRLARLSLDQDAQRRAQQDLANIIEMIDAMQSINTDGIEPMANPLDAHQRLRSDEVTEVVDVATFQAHAPATEDGYYLVPRVVE